MPYKGTILISLIPLVLWTFVDNSKEVINTIELLHQKDNEMLNSVFNDEKREKILIQQRSEETFNIAIFSCGESRLEETINLIKSIFIFSKSVSIHIYLFSDMIGDRVAREMQTLKVQWVKNKADIRLTVINPYNNDQIKNFNEAEFAPCANLRLFLPDLLPRDIGKIVYLDTDVLVLANPKDLFFSVFQRMKDQDKMLALTMENTNSDLSYYYKYSILPSRQNGLNSGVIFMDLDYMRKYLWTDRVKIIFSFLKKFFVFGDQDIINFLYFYKSNLFLELNINYNFRPDHCFLRKNPLSKQNGRGVILHGSRSAFHKNNYPRHSFKTLKWFFNSLMSNPVLALYGLKLSDVDNEYAFFQDIFGQIDELSPQKKLIASTNDAEAFKTKACSDYWGMIIESLHLYS